MVDEKLAAFRERNGGKRASLGTSDHETKAALWAGYVNQYFGSILYLVPPDDDERLLREIREDRESRGDVVGGLGTGEYEEILGEEPEAPPGI